MSYSRVLRWPILALLLAVTLTLKWTSHPSELNDRDDYVRVADFFTRQHFVVSMSQEAKQGEPSVQATAPGCRILVVKSPVVEWDQDKTRQLASAADQVFVVYAGKVYARQPTFLTVRDYLWSRVRRELGMEYQSSFVLTIIATKACDAERLPWNELA